MNEQPRTRVVRAGTAPRRPLRLGRGDWESLVGDQLPPGGLDVRRLVIEPGSVPGPLHRHRSVDNSYVVLAGEVEVHAGEEHHRLAAGDAILIPAGVPHATHNPTGQASVLLAVYDGPIDDDIYQLASPGKT